MRQFNKINMLVNPTQTTMQVVRLVWHEVTVIFRTFGWSFATPGFFHQSFPAKVSANREFIDPSTRSASSSKIVASNTYIVSPTVVAFNTSPLTMMCFEDLHFSSSRCPFCGSRRAMRCEHVCCCIHGECTARVLAWSKTMEIGRRTREPARE